MRRLALVIGLAMASGLLTACASPQGDLSAIPGQADSYRATLPASQQAGLPGTPAAAPSGYVSYCQRVPDDCRTPRGAANQVPLSENTLSMLENVNNTVNQSLRPIDDSVHYGVSEYWTVPVDGYGDCEDYVLAKRKMLMLLGLPEPALRISVVLSRGIVRHAVLTVVTDRGDYVLDNLRDDVLTVDKTDYKWIERQDPASRTGWIAMN